jgi:hypothetical protein
MGYLGYFYVEAKSFEFCLEIGFVGVRLAKRSGGVFRAVVGAGRVCFADEIIGGVGVSASGQVLQ